jgi:hypothetical protein
MIPASAKVRLPLVDLDQALAVLSHPPARLIAVEVVLVACSARSAVPKTHRQHGAEAGYSTITRSVAPRPNTSGEYISSALGEPAVKVPGVVARAV